MRLLVVEDAAKVARLLERGLTEQGFAVDVVASGSDAVWMATEHEYDAIVLDVRLSDVDGFEVCRLVRMITEGHAGRLDGVPLPG